jgi:hypothetical protein
MFSKVQLIKWNVRLVIFVMLVIFLLCPSITSAYTLLGPKWVSVNPLYWYMENWVGYNTRVAFTYSLQDWNAAGTKVHFQNSVSYKVYLAEGYVTGVTWDGITYYGYRGSTMTWASSYLNMYYTDGYGTNKRRSVSGHELGHALGLGEMTVGAELMNRYTSSRYDYYGVYTPQQDDINGINAMYP